MRRILQPQGLISNRLAVQTVKTALNWPVREGRIAENPLKGVRQGSMKRRERILAPEERAATAGDPFGDSLRAWS